jgi:hypothetical protein
MSVELLGKAYGSWVGETETVWRSAACSGEQTFDGTKQRRKKVLKDKDSRIRRASK